MIYILFFVAILSFLGGVFVLVVSQSALQEIEAFILFLISAVLLSGASIIEAIINIGQEIITKITDKKSNL